MIKYRVGGVSIISLSFIIILVMALVSISSNKKEFEIIKEVGKNHKVTLIPKTAQTNKWSHMLEFALLKNKANVGVGCKERRIKGINYILCEYSLFKLFGKRNFALFMREGDTLYAVNGTSKNLLHYDEIIEYDINALGMVDIMSIKNQFKR